MKKLKRISALICMVLALSVMMSATALAWGYDDRNNRYNPVDSNLSNKTKVGFYIQVNGDQMDVNGNVASRGKDFFTGMVAEAQLENKLAKNYTVVLGEKDDDLKIANLLKSMPNEDSVLKKVVKEYEKTDAAIYSSNGKLIPWSKLTTDYYRIRWYVLKCEDDFWHVDGVIVDLETNKEITIVVPDKEAERAACVEYDVKSGKFTPGFMNVMANRPHSYWKGSNDELIIDGFNDVWYTVLNEDTFKANNAVIPSELVEAATAIESLASARLSELGKSLQKQYGRIDSQAYKQEYVDRTGAGKTLYVTPFITKALSSKYGVKTNKYVWLAMGDSNGNINKVYVMDRKLAEVDNLFDEE